MPEPTPRKFTMADLMILIAGCAVGIAATQLLYKDTFGQIQEMGLDMWQLRLTFLLMSPTPTLTSISVALLACRLRRPRPKLRRLFRQPGTVAITCVPLLFVLQGALLLASLGLDLVIKRIWPPAPNPSSFSVTIPGSLATLFTVSGAGTVIAACWLLLLAVGRWKPEPTWIDRSGRLLGVCWIAIDLATSILGHLFT